MKIFWEKFVGVTDDKECGGNTSFQIKESLNWSSNVLENTRNSKGTHSDKETGDRKMYSLVASDRDSFISPLSSTVHIPEIYGCSDNDYIAPRKSYVLREEKLRKSSHVR